MVACRSVLNPWLVIAEAIRHTGRDPPMKDVQDMPKAGAKKAVVPKKIVKRAIRNRAPIIAAVDLGSNSFHLVIAKVEDGKTVAVDRLREMLRFGSGLDRQGHIKPAAQKAALGCLRRFGQRLALWHPELIRAVGTNTLRQAKGGELFLHKASLKLGVPIDVISGVEEARLIYRGVSPVISPGSTTLVMDIGGGSTEIIVGAGPRPEILESVTIGCVTLTDRVFRGHVLTEARFAQAEALAHDRLAPLKSRFRTVRWQQVLGSSGTIRAVESVGREIGLAPQFLTLPGLYEIKERVLRQRHFDRLVLPGLASERAPVFAGGLAILIVLFEAFGLKRMEVARGALREGILQDLMGRLGGSDIRDEVIAQLAAKWSEPRGPRVAERAATLFQGVAEVWRLSAEDGQILQWAAQLHACGLMINTRNYQEHSAYIVAHQEMAGVSYRDQRVLAALVGLQRGPWIGATLASVKHDYGLRVVRLAILLRLALALVRFEEQGPSLAPRLIVRGAVLEIHAPTRSMAARDALRRDLGPELSDMKKSGVRFLLAE